MKTMLEELRERVRLTNRYTEKGVCFRPSPLLTYTPEGIGAVNAAAGDIVRRYYNEREIMHGPTKDCITLYNAPIDVLPFLPIADHEISVWGKYDVYQRGKYVGTVKYNGWPAQDTPGIAIVGADTTFTPAEKVPFIECEISIL